MFPQWGLNPGPLTLFSCMLLSELILYLLEVIFVLTALLISKILKSNNQYSITMQRSEGLRLPANIPTEDNILLLDFFCFLLIL